MNARPVHQHRGGGISTERALWRRHDPLNMRTARTLADLDFNPQTGLHGPFVPPETRRARILRRALLVLIIVACIGAACAVRAS